MAEQNKNEMCKTTFLTSFLLENAQLKCVNIKILKKSGLFCCLEFLLKKVYREMFEPYEDFLINI